MTTARPFTIDVPQAKLDRIRAAVANPFLPPAPADDTGWRYGVDVKWLGDFLRYWAEDYDWRAEEARLNRWPQIKAEIDGVGIHAFCVRGSASRPRPVIMTHGWPGSAFEFIHLIEPLCFPERFGGDPEDGLDLIIPSLPGVGFSNTPPVPMGPREIAGLYRKLMVDVLGHARFAAQGGDLGSAVSTWLGCDHADVCVAIHLNLCIPPMSEPALDEADAAWRAAYQQVQMRESAYMFQHATKPQTVAVALAASPVALAGWVIEKFQSWADTGGDIDSRFSRDTLIANLMFYLADDHAGTAIWLYRGAAAERATGRFEGLKVSAPTAIALFPQEFLPHPPRNAVERYYNLARWTEMAAGGHFAALEEPKALGDDLRDFLRDRL